MFLLGTNLKMHQTPGETGAFVRALCERLPQVAEAGQVALWVTVPYTSLAPAASVAHTACQGAHITIGAQNMHWADAGAYTGEISPLMLAACGAEFVMLGHAERRSLFGETDALLNRKVLAAARHKLDILLCVGEPAQVKSANAGDVYVETQLRLALATLPPAETGRLRVLYEPLWSVGADGQAADPVSVGQAFDNIKTVLAALFGEAGGRVPILYGGGVDAVNCAHYARLPNCDGLGVGRAGWHIDSLLAVLGASLAARSALAR